jgi:hypothetical protein
MVAINRRPVFQKPTATLLRLIDTIERSMFGGPAPGAGRGW